MQESHLPSLRTVFGWVGKLSRDLLAVGLIILAAGEIYLRTWAGETHSYAADPELGPVLCPRQEANAGRLNRDGHRGPETDWTKPALIAVGDSQAFGQGVADEEVWTARLSEKLGEQVVNAAHPGFGPQQQCVRLCRLLEQHTPRCVLVRVSIEDRNFAPPPPASIPGVAASLELKAKVRAVTRLVPYLKTRAEQQCLIMSRTFQSQGRAGGPGPEEVGEAMWLKNDRWWRKMADAAEQRGVPLVFFVHDPTDLPSNRLIERRLREFAQDRWGIEVLRLDSRAWGLRPGDAESQWRQYHARYTQQHDDHGNALHHEVVARVLYETLAK